MHCIVRRTDIEHYKYSSVCIMMLDDDMCVQSFNHLLLYADDRLKIKELEGVSAMRVNLFT